MPGSRKGRGLRAAPGSLFCPVERREAGARPAISWHGATTCGPEGQPETPEKLCECKNRKPFTCCKRAGAVGGETGAVSVGVHRLQGHRCPRSGSPTSREEKGKEEGQRLGLAWLLKTLQLAAEHYSVLIFTIRLTGRKESGCTMQPLD